MNYIDLFADIIPGKSAAGFELGFNIIDFSEIASTAASWNVKIFQIQEAVSMTLGWLCVPDSQLGGGPEPTGCNYYYGGGSVRLHFNFRGILDCITVSAGYKGRVFDNIEIGRKLIDVCEYFELIYDDVEELHFPADSSGISGIIFQAEQTPLELSPYQLIEGIIIE